MKHLGCVLLILFLVILSEISVFGEDIKQITIASEEWENNTNNDGTGLYWDIIRKIFDFEDIKLQIKIVPYARSVHMVKTQNADAWVGSYINEEPLALYPKWHFDADIVSALFNKNKFTNWQGMASLNNKKVGWVRGYDYNQYINVKMEIHEVNSRESGLKLLAKDRLDVLLDAIVEIQNALNNKEFLTQIGFNKDEFRIEKLLQLNLYLAFANNERGKHFSAIWDKNFPILLKNGTIKALFDKYKMKTFPFEIGK